MKTIIILIAVCIFLIFLALKKRTKVSLIRPFELVTLESESQSTEYLPKVPGKWLTEIETKYKSVDYKVHPNEYAEIMDKLCGDVYSQSKYWKQNLSHSEFLRKLTKEQRIIFALANFEGQTNNGGVYQFLFNQPELSLIALDAMIITRMDTLAKDYEHVLHELFGKTETIGELKKKFQDNSRKWTSRWNAFVEGYNEIKSAEVIEGYFYDAEFINQFHKRIVEYIKANQNNLFIEE